jgi:hypothetical protein
MRLVVATKHSNNVWNVCHEGYADGYYGSDYLHVVIHGSKSSRGAQMTKKANPRPKTRLDRRIIAWQGRQFWNQAFSDDIEVKVDEIRELLDTDADCCEGDASDISDGEYPYGTI